MELPEIKAAVRRLRRHPITTAQWRDGPMASSTGDGSLIERAGMLRRAHCSAVKCGTQRQ